jgi:hypothetical protein
MQFGGDADASVTFNALGTGASAGRRAGPATAATARTGATSAIRTREDRKSDASTLLSVSKNERIGN